MTSSSNLPIPVSDPRPPSGRVLDPEPRLGRIRRIVAPFSGDTSGTDRVARRERAYRRSLALTDVLCATCACLVSISVLGTDSPNWASLALLPLLVLTAKLLGLYDRDELLIRKTTADEVPALLQLATTYALIIWLTGSTFIDGDLSREQVFGLWMILFVTMVAGRWMVRGALGRILTPERCLVVGSKETTQRFTDKLADNPVNAEVVGRLALDEWQREQAVIPVQAHEGLGETLDQLQVDRVVVVPDDHEPEAMLSLIRAVKSLGVRVSVLPHVLEVVGSAVAFDDLFGMPVLGVRRFGLTRSSAALKRTIDLAASAIMLIVSAPLMAAIAILIKLDSPGPVFFRQERMGKDGEPFRMLKFRSMVVDAEDRKGELEHANETDGLFKIAEDPRITRVGRHIRALSLDELPQLINVMLGNMSMVGPRPLVIDEDAKISGLDRRRLALTPGITGPWQILGSGRVPLSEMVQIDYLYAANWSSWGDVKILMRTIIYVLRRGGV